MKKMEKSTAQKVLLCIAAAAIPALLAVDGIQSRRYSNLENEVIALEQKETELVEENKKLVTQMSLLSSSDRIEKIAGEDLGMHKAKTDEIVRVEIKGSKK